ncbi:hypothetical protein HYPSUDRAFT_458596 [Hypholoma sublateritium FD-334 SS-4]|uniref:Uncharacterized protein n=1 Tax=Hypholoma sublateritium (strain FD-334 SS-4) TaxID=945553 RepID=A0A0D2N531_HYPSF|nr:hypothetical protein HYPSUDRAFT_458596 [Hypholoma sublateritium FD-334 SS-4]
MSLSHAFCAAWFCVCIPTHRSGSSVSPSLSPRSVPRAAPRGRVRLYFMHGCAAARGARALHTVQPNIFFCKGGTAATGECLDMVRRTCSFWLRFLMALFPFQLRSLRAQVQHAVGPARIVRTGGYMWECCFRISTRCLLLGCALHLIRLGLPSLCARRRLPARIAC